MTTASALFLLAGVTAAPPAHVWLDLAFDGWMPPRLEAAAMEEVTAIWSSYGVDVRRRDPGAAVREGAIALDVVLEYDSSSAAVSGTLGSIRFLDSVPEPVIVMYPNTIAALVQSVTLHGHAFNDWPFGFRDGILGRVFGRALAHELGHFLLRSREHADEGLMQPRHDSTYLVAPDRRPFELTKAEASRFVRGAAVSLP